MNCICNIDIQNCNCNNCYKCLKNVDLDKQFNKIMEISVNTRLLYCNCFMCNDRRSANCYEISYMYKYKTSIHIKEMIEKERKKIKRRIILLYFKCVGRFLNLYKDTIEKFYTPGGKGFLLAMDSFTNKLK